MENKTIRAMQLVIPAMILCFIGDYCIGIEPADSTSLGSATYYSRNRNTA